MDYISINPDKFEDNISELSNAATGIESCDPDPDDAETKGFAANRKFHTAFEKSQSLNSTISGNMTDMARNLNNFNDVVIEVNEKAEEAAS